MNVLFFLNRMLFGKIRASASLTSVWVLLLLIMHGRRGMEVV